MAKLSRNDLKALVKECLVEILAEGIGNSARIPTSNARTVPRRKVKRPSEQNEVRRKLKVESKRFDTALDNTVSSLTDDIILQEIFADTARTTLQEQGKHDVGKGIPAPLVDPSISPSGIDLGGIFDSAKDSWSSLAFSENSNRAIE